MLKLEKASVEIINMIQKGQFAEELKIIKKAYEKNIIIKDQITVTKSNPIYSFDLSVDNNGVFRVKDLLKNSYLNGNIIHAILLKRI